jgi:hypothetical protein
MVCSEVISRSSEAFVQFGIVGIEKRIDIDTLQIGSPLEEEIEEIPTV